MSAPLRAVLFDMDGTLVDSEPVHHRALLDVMTALKLEVPAGFDEEMTGKSMRTLWEQLRARTALSLDYAELAAAKYRAFLARRAELSWRAGARAAWDWCDAQGIARAVVSNSDRMLVDAGLGAIGVTAPDLVSVTRNDVRDGKPAAEPYLRAAWLLGAEPAQCLVVEDSIPGAAAGLAAGMRVIAWPEPVAAATAFPDGVLHADPQHLLATLQMAARQASPD